MRFDFSETRKRPSWIRSPVDGWQQYPDETFEGKLMKGQKISLDLRGEQGNAFYLLSAARGFARQLGLDWVLIQAEMQEGDYANLIKVFDKHFGRYVILNQR